MVDMQQRTYRHRNVSQSESRLMLASILPSQRNLIADNGHPVIQQRPVHSLLHDKSAIVVHLISFSFYLGMVPFVCKDNTLLINKRDKASFFTCSYKVPRDGLRRGASTVKVAFAGRFGFQPVTKGIQMHFVPTGIGGVGS